MNRILSIQYLRAIAALAVVVFHALEATDHKFPIGAAGVDIFFVISGFIMAGLVSEPDVRPGSFIWRRLVRIVPLYWVVTLCAAAIGWVRPDFFYRLDPSFENILWSLAFLPHASDRGVTPVLWQGWTLEYEMFFYALCALAVLAVSHRLKILVGVLSLLVLLGLVAPLSGPMLLTYTNPLLLEFVFGVALGAAWRANALPTGGVAWLLLGSGFAAYAGQVFLPAGFTGYRVIDWGVPAFLIVAGALGLERAGKAPVSKMGLLFGDASYSIYLTHGFVVALFGWYFADAPLVVRVVVCVAGSLLVAVASYRWFEKPVMNGARALTKSWRTVRARWTG
ncbi:MAG: acyltransferase [Hyphomonadaceae bacterium]|nr:acyltransferase [Hyphomonadaceae bacterium]